MAELARSVDRDAACVARAAAQRERWGVVRERLAKLNALPVFVPSSSTTIPNNKENDLTLTLPNPNSTTSSTASPTTTTKLTAPTQPHFDSIPRYVRGRVTFADVCAVVDLANAAAERKQAVLALPPAKQNVRAKQAIAVWTEQAKSIAAAGGDRTFVSDADLADASRGSVAESTIRAALQCLRHLGHVRVVGGNVYVFLR